MSMLLRMRLRQGQWVFIVKTDGSPLSEDINGVIRSIARGEKYFFNAPILKTVVDGFQEYAEELSKRPARKSPGFFHLSEKDILHLQLMAEGKSNSQISWILQKKDGNAYKHEKSIDARQIDIANNLKVSNIREHILMKAIQEGLIDPYSIKIPPKN